MMQLMEMQTMSIRLPKDLHEELRLAAFEDRTSQTAIIVDAVRDRLAARRLRGGQVAHLDGNPRNNDPANLEVREGRT
jgi:metal-responsive CopG/Arc/MetJ family transcriptional regulator